MWQQQPSSEASGRHPAAKFHGSLFTQRTPLAVLDGQIVLNERTKVFLRSCVSQLRASCHLTLRGAITNIRRLHRTAGQHL
jgi:hypothetical protein